MIVSDVMPSDEQFVALWFTPDGLPFSATMKWEDGQLKSHDHIHDCWDCECDHGYSREFFESHGANFYQ